MNFIVFLPLIILAVCMLMRIPIAHSMLCACIVYLFAKGADVGIVAHIVTSNLFSNVVMIAVPLFIFTANIMESGKVTEHMFTFSKALVGRKRGAMAYINIIMSLIFSGMSGSAYADAAGIGTMELSEMKKDGYDDAFSSALTAATAVVGPVFPPSIPLVTYAMIAGVSVGQLFMGGMIPAVLICFALGIYVWYISRKRNYPRGVKFTLKEFLKYTLKAFPALLTPVILLGGMYSGIVTATEAGALAAAYAIIVSILAYRVLTFKGLLKAIKNTVITTGVIIVITTSALVLSYVVTSSGLGVIISEWFLQITDNKYVFMFIINIAFLILGMFFDASVFKFVFVPLVLPIVNALGIDLIYFGVVITVNMMVGMVSPPYGMLCFITSGITCTPLQKVFREIIPMCIVLFAVLLLITYVPALVMAIPNLMGP